MAAELSRYIHLRFCFAEVFELPQSCRGIGARRVVDRRALLQEALDLA
jgi:hypothetical protein